MTTVKERRQAKAIKRSQAATPGSKKVHRSEADFIRLERFKRSQILFRKFKL